jgi:hypothetical protein
MTINAIERWNTLSEEDKTMKVLSRAFQAIQTTILNIEQSPTNELEEYLALNRAMLDWLAPKVGWEGCPLYYGPGPNSANNT